MRKNWYTIHHRNSTFKAERIRIMGEELVNDTINEEGIQEFYNMKEVAEEVFSTCGRGLPERVYNDYMVEVLRKKYTSVIQEQRQPYIINNIECGSIIPDILASNENGDYVIEVKISNVNKGLLQIGQYILNNYNKVGYLVNYGVSGVEMYMIVSVSESDVVCYDGCKLYKMNLMANRSKNSEEGLP